MEQLEGAMETPMGEDYTICTGGAEGTDSMAKQCARELAMNVVLKIPLGHPRSRNVSPLSQLQLNQADEYVKRASQVLAKTPAFTNTSKANLLRRNVYIPPEPRPCTPLDNSKICITHAPSKVVLGGPFNWPWRCVRGLLNSTEYHPSS